jgi:hypothetical protein
VWSTGRLFMMLAGWPFAQGCVTKDRSRPVHRRSLPWDSAFGWVRERGRGLTTRIHPQENACSNDTSAVGSQAAALTRTIPTVLVLMGIAGSGKTTVAGILVLRLGWRFQEGDALHPQSNVEKMRCGHPLTDGDRAEWLKRVADWVEDRLQNGQNGIITCSALKRSYRDLINRRGSAADLCASQRFRGPARKLISCVDGSLSESLCY